MYWLYTVLNCIITKQFYLNLMCDVHQWYSTYGTRVVNGRRRLVKGRAEV